MESKSAAFVHRKPATPSLSMSALPDAVLRCPEWRRKQYAARAAPFVANRLPAGPSAVFASGYSGTPFGAREPTTVYKAVAVVTRGGKERYHSIYAGRSVEYIVGQVAVAPTSAQRKQLYCFARRADAQRARVPENSRMRSNRRVVLECRPASDDGVLLPDGKLCFSALLPTRRLDDAPADDPATWQRPSGAMSQRRSEGSAGRRRARADDCRFT